MSHQRCDSMIAEPSSRRSTFRRRGALPAERPERVDLRQERVARALQRLERESARAVGCPREPARPDERERALRSHELRAVDQRQALLGDQPHRLEPGAPQRVAAGQQLALVPRLALADERQRQVRERREIARGSDRPARRHPRQNAAFRHSSSNSTVSIRAPELPFASAFARSSIAARTTSSGYGSPTPHACERSRRSCSSSVSSSGICFETNRPKPVFTPYVCSLEPCAARSTSARAALHRGREPTPTARAPAHADRDRPDVRRRQVVARQRVAVTRRV